MALLTCDFFSEALEVGTTISVVLPQRTEDQIGVERAAREGPPPVLYLLHGLTDDHTAWSRYTSIGRYAEAAGLAVVMPSVHHSFYADEVHGHRYWTFVSEELPGRGPVVLPGLRPSRRTPSSPACRWAGTAPSSSRSPTRTGTPRLPRCPAPSTSSGRWRTPRASSSLGGSSTTP